MVWPIIACPSQSVGIIALADYFGKGKKSVKMSLWIGIYRGSTQLLERFENVLAAYPFVAGYRPKNCIERSDSERRMRRHSYPLV